MQTKCIKCNAGFEITKEDLAFYDKMKAPSPTHCPDCRLQRRLSWRNENHIYKRKCDLCNKDFIGLYRSDSPYTVYCPACFWSDKWDPMEYGMDFNFGRTFFEQFGGLHRKTPHLGVINEQGSLVNSDYVAYVSDAKNCYLVFAANFLEDCMYSHYVWECKDTVDCSNSTGLELCYECVDCDRLFNCEYLVQSEGCSECYLGFDLKNCKNCFACVQLRNKEHYFLNEKLSKEDYATRIKETLANPEKLKEIQQKFEKLQFEYPRLYCHQIRCENSTGDAIKNCKNCHSCFEGYGGEDLKWVSNFPGNTKDSYDIFGCAELELALDCHAVGLPAYNVKYSNVIMNGGYNMTYCAYCLNGGRDMFGCVSMKKSQYCILNKQYSKEEYEKLTADIIEHMKKTDEWGEFFPAELSPFKYEETLARDYFPV